MNENMSMTVFVHKSPQKRTVIIDGEKYFLAIPHVLYVLYYVNPEKERYIFRNLYVFFKSSKIKIKYSEEVCRPLLGNCHYDCRVCTDKATRFRRFEGLKEMTSAVIEDYWSSEFNCDLGNMRSPFLDKWRKETKEKGFFDYEKEYNEYLKIDEFNYLTLGTIPLGNSQFVLELGDESSH